MGTFYDFAKHFLKNVFRIMMIFQNRISDKINLLTYRIINIRQGINISLRYANDGFIANKIYFKVIRHFIHLLSAFIKIIP